jgi:2-iminobutanoate/2-iminopropanoate deaminase
MKKIINTPDAPAAIGPYSQAVEANGMLFLSGQLPIDPATKKLVEGGIKEQTEQVMKNIDAILKKAGYKKTDVVKSTCLLNDMEDFKGMNDVYEDFYSIGLNLHVEVIEEQYPARVTYAVQGLPLGALVEIETIAVKTT